MPRGRPKKTAETKLPERRPALGREAREDQLISLAIDRAEEQLRDGTASSQVIVHFLKLASTREKIEKEILEKQKEQLDAKTQAIRSQQRVEELYASALEAFRSYSGNRAEDDDDDYE